MSVAEPHPLAGQPIDIGCRYFGTCVVAAWIAIAHVIGHDQHDVGWRGGGLRAEGSKQHNYSK